jgi:flagellar hook protein FlgE
VASVNRAGYGGAGLLQTGAIEQSNVDVTSELVDLIEAQRNFQSNSKAIEATDRMKKAILDNLS